MIDEVLVPAALKETALAMGMAPPPSSGISTLLSSLPELSTLALLFGLKIRLRAMTLDFWVPPAQP